MRCIHLVFLATLAIPTINQLKAEDKPVPLQPGVRGLVTRAPAGIKIDGKLDEWSNAFCTPVNYSHSDLANRAAQFYYGWDDQAIYIAVRALDQKRTNLADLPVINDADAVELYLDTRSGDKLRSKDWSPGAIHLFFTPFDGEKLSPRWVMRRGITTSNIKLEGVEIAATTLSKDVGYEVEFKVPWKNFPEFSPKLGAIMALDAALCSSDGAGEIYRTFAYGSRLSIEQPASQGLVELVGEFEPEYIAQVGPSAFPIWVDIPWKQAQRALVTATVGIPPAFSEVVGDVEVRIHNSDGAIVKTLVAQSEPFGPSKLGFLRAQAFWPIDDYAPSTYFVTARLISRTGKLLTTVVPRMID